MVFSRFQRFEVRRSSKWSKWKAQTFSTVSSLTQTRLYLPPGPARKAFCTFISVADSQEIRCGTRCQANGGGPISLSPHAHPYAPTPHESSLPTAQTPLTRLPAGAFARLSKRLVHRRSFRFGPVSVQPFRTEERKGADWSLHFIRSSCPSPLLLQASALAFRDRITQAENYSLVGLMRKTHRGEAISHRRQSP